MLVVSTWLWGEKYSAEDVRRLVRGVRKNLRQQHRFMVMTERERLPVHFGDDVERHAIKDPELLQHKGCFARLRMFDYGWQSNRKIDDRLVCMDLDTIVTGPLDDLFDRPEKFVILGGANSMNPCPFNGSLMMLRPGHLGHLWTDFSMEAASKIPRYQFPDDQGWVAHLAPDSATWPCGRRSGIYAFKKPGWPLGSLDLPAGAKMIVFPGSKSPNMYTHLAWVKQHWL